MALAAVLVVSTAETITPPIAVAAPPPTAPARVDSRPDVVSAAVTARAQGSKVEVESMRTETSTTWSNPDGTMTTDQHAAQIRFKDAEGRWRDVDLTWRKQRDGKVTPGGHALGLRLGRRNDKAGAAFVATTSDGARQVEWLAPWKLPEPQLDGTKAKYVDVQPDVDLTVDVRRQGFEVDFVVKKRPQAAPVWRIPLRVPGLTAKPQPDGEIHFVDDAGEVRSTIPVGHMWDAATDKSTGEPVSKVVVKVGVEDVQPGQATLVVEPDAEWFMDPARAFPVTVDPTYQVGTTKASFDTWVQTGVTTDQSASQELRVGNNGSSTSRSFLNFSTSAFAGRQILSASLSLWQWGSTSCTPSAITARSATPATTATRWTAQPTIGQSYGSVSAAKGFSSACPGGRISIPMTGLAQAWSTAPYPTGGLALIAGNEADTNSWKKFYSTVGIADPYITLTWNRHPGVPAVPTWVSAVSYAPPGGTSALYSPYRNPWISTKATDADGNTVRYDAEFHTSTTTSSTTLKATCSTGTFPSGSAAGCKPAVDLPDNTTMYVRARTYDGGLYSAWSGWNSVRIGATTPTAPAVTCPEPYRNGSWHDDLPATDITCTITATGSGYSAPGYVRVTVDGAPLPTNFTGGAPGQIKITPTGLGGTGQTTVTLPKTAGLHAVKAQAETPAGRFSATTTHSFGYGSATLSSPVVSPRLTTTGGVGIAAAGPPKGSSATPTASLRWRLSGYGTDSESTGWNTTTNAPLTVTDNGAAGVTVSGTWNTAAETQDSQLDADPNTTDVQPTPLNARVSTLLDVQVCLTYSTSTQCTWSQTPSTVLRVPHAFGNGFPTADAGPGQVALWTGEFNAETTDVSVPGYTGNLSLSRAHSTFAGPADAVHGVFGPGWTAQFDGADAGVAGMRVVDNTRVDGTISLVDGEGSTLVYQSPSGNRRRTSTLETGPWRPADEETELDAGKLTVAGTGAATTIAYTEDDGTITTFATTAADSVGWRDWKFFPASIAEPGVAAKTTYTYDASGRVARIVAPTAPGVTCTDAQGVYNNAVGCRSLRIEYGTSGSANGRLVAAWLDIFNPDRAGGPGMDAIKVAAYTYDSAGRLASVTDPRSNLGTTYGYDSGNRLTSVKPAGQVPFQLSYTAAPDVKLAGVKRDRPAGDPTGGIATLASFVYDVPTTGNGLPDLSAASVERWNQAVAPVKGFAVFGPDHPVNSTSAANIAAGDWEYADLQYTDAQGYTVNTAKYGAGAWQHTATDYNAQGNVVRELDERALRMVIDGQLPSGATVDQLATLTVYNADIMSGDTVVTPAGTLVTDTYGPARTAALRDGTVRWLRTHSRTEFDQGAPNGGINPATTLPYRLPTSETTHAHDPGTGQDLEVVSRSFTDYNPAVAGGPDGWALSLPGRVTTDADLDGTVSAGDIVKLTRYDAEGRVVETRQPTSNGADAGTTRTAYYSAAANTAHPECGGKPQWAGLVCKTYPAAAPSSGPTLPSTSNTGYSYLLAPVTVVETSGAVTRTSTTTHLPDGRTASTSIVVAGLPGSTPNTRKETEYDPLSGAATKVIAKNADGSTAGTITTGYDAWGRQTTYQPSGEAVTTTVYDASGAVATVTDANGSTRYTYDGTDASGRTERRGMATKVEVTTAGSTWTSTGAYDADGSLVTEKLPGGITRHVDLDHAGEPIGLRYTGRVTTVNDDGTTTVDPDGGWLGWSQDNDVTGRVAREWTPDGSAFTGPAGDAIGDAIPYDRAYGYDAVGRLVQVRDRTADATGVDVTDPAKAPACVTRTYTFDGNDNRRGLTTTPAASDGTCTTTGGTTVTRAFDTADRPTAYTHDPLGRATTLPAADLPGPQAADAALSYYDNDLARTITRGGTTTTFTLDAIDRRAVETSGTEATARHYTDGSDNPTWVTSSNGVTRRYAELVGDDLALTVTGAGDADLTIANPHDDVVTTVQLPTSGEATAIGAWNRYDEYGNALTGHPGTGEVQYGWLGAKQRATTRAGLLLMGVRLYNPVTGLFTSTDPVAGGNNNAYTHPTDPVNMTDLDGRWGCGKWCKRVKSAGKHVWKHRVAYAGGAALLACTFATAGLCGAVSAVAVGFSVGGNYRKWRSGSMSGRSFAINSGLDLFTGRFKAVRSMGFHRARHYKGSRFKAFWRKRHEYNFRSTRRAFKRHPWRSGIRVARHGYGFYRSYSGRNLPDF